MLTLNVNLRCVLPPCTILRSDIVSTCADPLNLALSVGFVTSSTSISLSFHKNHPSRIRTHRRCHRLIDPSFSKNPLFGCGAVDSTSSVMFNAESTTSSGSEGTGVPDSGGTEPPVIDSSGTCPV